MKKIIFSIVLVLGVLFFSGCTENQRAKQFGGSLKIKIDKNEKFVNATWKKGNLWIVTKKRNKNETTKETYYFKEDSSFGLMEGEIKFIEQ